MAKRVQKVTFTVTQDVSGRWNVARNGVATGGFARGKDMAIGLAYGDASREQATSEAEVTVWSIDTKGKRTKEWPTG